MAFITNPAQGNELNNLLNAHFIADSNETIRENETQKSLPEFVSSGPVPVFTKEFRIADDTIKSATLDITAYGIYEAYINGEKVGNFLFAPGFTSYGNRIQYQSYQVAKYLHKGENKIEIYVADGWFFGGICYGSYSLGKRRSVIASLTITTEGGEIRIITDKSWKVASSATMYSDIYNGETYDSRYTPVEFRDVSIEKSDKSIIIPTEGEIVTVTEEVPAISLIITPKGERVIDFGQNLTGYVSFRAYGEKNSQIVIDHAEVLDRFGNFYTDNLRTAKQRVTYICNGKEAEYHPSFSFQGFRYIRLTEFPEEVFVGDFKALVIHSDIRRTGYFECSEPMINQLYHNIIWGQRGNYLDIPTDCPQRDEREGWTGDANVFCRAALYNFDVRRFYAKWLHDLAFDQREDGAVPSIVPMCWPRTGYGCFAWGDSATVCPWELYKAYGDKQILRDQIESMKAWVRYVHNKGFNPEAWGSGPQYGDWLSLDEGVGDSTVGGTSFAFLGTAFLAYSAEIVAKSLRALNEDATEFEEITRDAKSAFRRDFVLHGKRLTCDTQTAYVIALAFDLVEDKQAYADRLAEKVIANGNKISTGFIGTAYIMDALSTYGHADVAYSLLLQKEFPSWLYSVRKGATTIWEHWDGIKPDGTMWSEVMNSFNHYSYGAVAAWMYGTICGIKPDEENPGYKHIIVAPIPDKRMKYAKASLDTDVGTIISEWKESGDGYEYHIVIPDGANATVTIGGIPHDVLGGDYRFFAKADAEKKKIKLN